MPETVSTYDRLLVSVTLEKREGACALYKKLQKWLQPQKEKAGGANYFSPPPCLCHFVASLLLINAMPIW